MKLHLLGLPHTVTTDAFSHCAFTTKIKKFSPMMRPLGYQVVHYGVAGADSGANVQIDVLTQSEQHALLGHSFDDPSRLYEKDVDITSKLYRTFNDRLRDILDVTVSPGDLVLNTYGWAHVDAIQQHKGINVESGIGYPDCFLPYRIYDSYAWMHFQQGKHGWDGNPYEWVIPNYFVLDEWDFVERPKGYVLFLGRISTVKGCHIVSEVAKACPDIEFILCGQGDAEPFLQSPNITYHPPVSGRERSALMGNASAVMMPTQYIEPFGKVAVEAMLCGTPVLTPTYGAFVETVQDGFNGYHCRVLQDWIDAVRQAPSLSRYAIAHTARRKYSLAAIGPMYDEAFKQIADIHTEGGGWYSYRRR